MRSILSACLLSVLLGACTQPAPSDPSRLREIHPFLPYFTATQSLVADEVHIEGPQGLLEHVAMGNDPSTHLYTTKTTPDGLLQVVAARPGIDAAANPIRVQVDTMELRVLQRVVILERVDKAAFELRAKGAVWWAREDGLGGEVRQDLLVLPRDLPPRLLEASSLEADGGR